MDFNRNAFWKSPNYFFIWCHLISFIKTRVFLLVAPVLQSTLTPLGVEFSKGRVWVDRDFKYPSRSWALLQWDFSRANKRRQVKNRLPNCMVKTLNPQWKWRKSMKYLLAIKKKRSCPYATTVSSLHSNRAVTSKQAGVVSIYLRTYTDAHWTTDLLKVQV